MLYNPPFHDIQWSHVPQLKLLVGIRPKGQDAKSQGLK